jgi:hypothetical protein
MASPNNIAKLPRIKPGRRGSMAQLLEIQRVVFEDARNEKTKPHLRAGLARAWKELEELKRKIKGKPDPKPIDVSPEAQAKRARRFHAEPQSYDPSLIGSDPTATQPDNSKASPDAEIQLPKIEGWQPLWAQQGNG